MAQSAARQTASVTHLRTLALMVADHTLSAFDLIRLKADRGFMVFDPTRPTRYTFSLEDVPYATTLTPEEGDRFSFRISARLGTIPFTVQSPERRSAVLRLLKLCRRHGDTHFVPGRRQVLWIMSSPKTIEKPTPESVLYETVEFVQQIRPYARVVQPYLEAPAAAA